MGGLSFRAMIHLSTLPLLGFLKFFFFFLSFVHVGEINANGARHGVPTYLAKLVQSSVQLCALSVEIVCSDVLLCSAAYRLPYSPPSDRSFRALLVLRSPASGTVPLKSMRCSHSFVAFFIAASLHLCTLVAGACLSRTCVRVCVRCLCASLSPMCLRCCHSWIMVAIPRHHEFDVCVCACGCLPPLGGFSHSIF